jgi:4-amino-4-deoxy-L-arabinose transferase-like glycosyltransferase
MRDRAPGVVKGADAAFRREFIEYAMAHEAAARFGRRRSDVRAPPVTVSLSPPVAQWRRVALDDVELAIGLIAAFTLLRLLSAAVVGLGVDEAYTLAIARQLQLSYFDHPPLHLWIVHLFSGILGYGRLARLPFVALFAGSGWLMFTLTRRLFGARAGLWAVLTLNVSAFFTVAAGSWVLPDGPLLFCLLGAASQLERLMFDEMAERAAWRRWLTLGLWLGLAGLSKYQAVIFGLGLAGFMLTTATGRAWLRRPHPYLAALLAVIVIAPVFVWNAQHHWASFAFQGGRAAAAHGVRPAAALTALAGQAALLLPWIFVPLAAAAFRALREGPSDERRWLCVMLGVPGVLLFVLIPLWGQPALPHWAMPSWLFLIPLLAAWLARAESVRRWPRIWGACALAACVALWALVASDADSGWIGRAWPAVFSKGDPTLQSVEWAPLAGQSTPQDLAGLSRPFVVAMKWNEAGRLRPLFADRIPVRVFSDDPRGFGDTRGVGRLTGRDALIFVRPEDLGLGLQRISGCFASVTPLSVATFGRGGAPEIQLHVFRGEYLLPACSDLGRRSTAAMTQWRRLEIRTAANAF